MKGGIFFLNNKQKLISRILNIMDMMSQHCWRSVARNSRVVSEESVLLTDHYCLPLFPLINGLDILNKYGSKFALSAWPWATPSLSIRFQHHIKWQTLLSQTSPFLCLRFLSSSLYLAMGIDSEELELLGSDSPRLHGLFDIWRGEGATAKVHQQAGQVWPALQFQLCF